MMMKRFASILILVLTAFTFSVSAQNELFNKGLQQYDAKQYEQAAETFKKVIEQSPRNHAAFYNLGLCYYFQKRYDQAAVTFQQAVNIKPDYTRAYIYLGNSLDLTNRYDQAVVAYNKAIALEPNNGQAFTELGYAHKNKKNYFEAEKAFKKATELNPNNADTKTQLGNVYVNLKKFPDAISAFNQAISLAPNSADAHLGLGNAYYNNNKWAESIPHYKKASELVPTWATAHLYLGDAYLNSKLYPNAVASFKQAISLDEKMAEAYYGLGITYFNQKNNALARQQLEKLKLLDPGKADLLAQKISSTASIPTRTPKPVVKSAQRIKDEQDVAKMVDLGFDAAFVTQIATVRDTPKTTGKLLLSVKRGDILSLVSRDESNNWYQVVDEKTGTEGWIDGKAVVVKLTNNTEATGPPILESGAGANTTANPVVLISNLEEKTTLSLRINGTLYQIPPKSTKSLSLPAGKMNYYGWSPGIRPTKGSSNLEKGKQYSWSFKINRR